MGYILTQRCKDVKRQEARGKRKEAGLEGCRKQGAGLFFTAETRRARRFFGFSGMGRIVACEE
jgi:hypothetical protein